MKKTTKGAVAAGAAVLLLLGSGGTLAYWNDTANLSGTNNITAGNLAVAQTGTPTWKIKHTSGAETTVTNIAAVRIVPGDQLIYEGTYDITAQGQNLKFQVGLGAGSIAPATSATADVALAGRLAATAQFQVDGGALTAAGTPVSVSHLNNTSGVHPVVIRATINWPFGDSTSPAADNPAKLGAVNLSQFTLNVTQVDGN